eukprot:94848_1
MDLFNAPMPQAYTDTTDKNNPKQYKVLHNLANGRYGNVQKVELITNSNHTNNNTTDQKQQTDEKSEDSQPNIYAIKSQDIFDGEITKKLQREIDIMSKLKSNNKTANPNIIPMIKYFIDTHYLLFLLPYFDSNLQKLLDNAPLKLDLIQHITYQLFNGLSYIHSLNIIHRDIKPNNILYNTQTQQISIADFGSARDITDILQEEKSEKSENKSDENKENKSENDGLIPNFDDPEWNGFDTETNCKLSPQIYVVVYRAPELLLGERQYRFSIDIWACGCLIAQMCREKGELLFNQSHDIPMFMEMLKILGGPKGDELKGVGLFTQFFQMESSEYNDIKKIVDGLDDNGYDLLAKIFRLGPKSRITAKEAVEHKFFQNVRK